MLRYVIEEELGGLGAKGHTCSRNETELSGCLKQWEWEWEIKGFQVTGCVEPSRELQANKQGLLTI